MNQQTIERIRGEYLMHRPDRAVYNAITNNDVKKISLNRDVLRRHSDLFSHRVETKGITNQEQSGRCWAFAGLNVLRPAVIEKYKLEKFEFAANYIAFWDKLEKANHFLDQVLETAGRDLLDRDVERILKSPFHEGGWWSYVAGLIRKYGVVPVEVMPETFSSRNSAGLHRVVSTMLRSAAVKLRRAHADGLPPEEIDVIKIRVLGDVYRVLVLNLGEPPREFVWRYKDKDKNVSDLKTYTPHSFYEEFVNVDLADYITLSHDPTQPYGKLYRLEHARNMSSGEDMTYANVEIDLLRQVAKESLADKRPCWFAADVSKDQSTEHGIMAHKLFDYDTVYDAECTMNKADRIWYREGSSNHAMTLLGVDLENDQPVKWLVENSWGDKKGADGYWTMYDDWFGEHVYNVIVHKQYVPQEVQAIFEQEPTVLPPWYPTAQLMLG